MADVFKPVKGTQAAINHYPIVDGQVLFAYDSGRIYLDKNGARFQMSSKSSGGGGGAGGTGIIYANGSNNQIIPVNLSEHEPTDFLMELAALEDPIPPAVDNLILNSDGRFFRVQGYDPTTEKISVKLLAVSGSGGGSGGGGGSSEPDVNISWDNETITTGRIYIYGQATSAVFTPTTTAAGDINCSVTFNVIDNINGTTETYTYENLPSGQPFEFDTTLLPESSNITLQVIVTSDNSQYNYGMGYQRNITGLRVVRMALEKPTGANYIPLVQADDLSRKLTLKYMPIGDSSLSVILHTYVDGEELGSGTPIASSYLGQVLSTTIPEQTHGVHTIKLQLSTDIGNKTIWSNAITYDGAWASSEDTRPIIWIGHYDSVITNYENSYITYMVFDPVSYANGMPAEIILQKDGIEISQIEASYSESNWLTWDISNIYTVDDPEALNATTRNSFSIVCGGEKVTLLIDVTTKNSRSLGLVAPENLILNMTAAGRSSSEIKRNRSVFQSTVNTSNITATLHDFNWQNNGWKSTDGVDANGVDSGAYLSIANGASMDIALAGNGIVLNSQKNYSFEFRFRVKNIQQYSTLVTTIPKYYYEIPDPENPGSFIPQYSLLVDEDGDTKIISSANPRSYYEWEIEEMGYRIGVDQYGNLLMDEKNSKKETETEKGVVVKWLNSNNQGFVIGTQEAYFKSPSGEVANVRYCEDEVINIAFVVSKDEKLCYVYLNGILSGAAALPDASQAGSSLTINAPFTFNSKYCDFDLYRFRIYELGLTMPQVIHNYLSDMHSITLYDQNQLTEEFDPTALSYAKLIEYNENHPEALTMPYATWLIEDPNDERLSYKKGNNRPATVEFVNPSLDRALLTEEITPWFYYTHCPSFYAKKVDLNVQGTSSQKYPRRNYKLKYKSAKDTWVYTQGPLAGYPLTSDYYFYKSSDNLVTVEKVNEETNETEIVPLTDKTGYNSVTMKKLTKKYHMDTESFGTNKFTWKIDYMESSGSYNTGFANLMGNLVHPLYTKHPLDDYNLGINTSDMRTTVYGFPVLTFHKYANGRYEYIGRYNMNLDKSSNEYYGFEEEVIQPYANPKTKRVKNETTGLWETVEYQPTIAEVAECWELKDNQGNWCSFKYPDAASRRTGFLTLQQGTSGDSARLELLNHYEYRYSYYADQLDAAYSYNSFTDPDTQQEISNRGEINNFLYQKHANFEILFNWLDSTNPDTASNTTLNPTKTFYVASTDLTDNSINYEVILNQPEVVTAYTLVTTDDAYDSEREYFYSTDDGNTFTPYEYNEETWADYVMDNKLYCYIKYDADDSYYVQKNTNYWFYNYISDAQFITDVNNGIIYKGKFSGSYKAVFSKDTREYRRQKFRAELSEHLDREYCLTYYVLTELLLCYDSRGKNLMMATFGPQWQGGNYIWYPIFYDIDTQLGLNNSGAYLWDYDADVTKDNLFSTPTSVLWNNLYDMFYDEIVAKYRVLRGISDPSSADADINGSLTYENIAGAYECNPNVFSSYAMMGVRPIIAIGLDEYYKFLAPALTANDYNEGKLYAGYYDTKGVHSYQQVPDYIYACQGDKKLTTELLLRNRLNYIDSWWMGGDYRAGVVENEIFVRANANHRDTSDLFLDSDSYPDNRLPASAAGANYQLQKYATPPTGVFDARPGAKIKPFLHQYVSYFADSQPSQPLKYDGSVGQEDGIWTNVDAGKELSFKAQPDLSQQITYIPGGDYISSLGDISLMYPNSLQIFHGQRMLDFNLGSDAPGYKNILINSGSDWSLAVMPLLQSVNISNLSEFSKELLLSGSQKLQEFRALGSIIERINLAPGAPLHTVHLPATMTTISFIQNQNLNKMLTTKPKAAKWVNKTTREEVEFSDINDWSQVELVRADPSEYRGLYIENVTDYVSSLENSGHSISTYEVQGGGLGYNSYVILQNLYLLKHGATRKQNLAIGLTDVEWTPYIVVENGTPYDSNETYYILNDHSSYDLYTDDDPEAWEMNLKNGLIYTYNTEYTHNEEETITNLDLLDNLIAQYLAAKNAHTASQFSNLSSSTEATMPTITGNLYVSNTVNTKIRETDLTDIYKQYFPYLSISAKYIEESKVTKYVRRFEDTGIIETIEQLRSDSIHPLAPTKNPPSRAGYDFIGWSTDPAGQNMFLPYQVDVNTGNGSYIDINDHLNSFSFTDQVTVLTLYAQFEVHQNVITIYSGNERIGAAIVSNGSVFSNPTFIYNYVNDLIDTSTGHNYIPYKDDSGLGLTQTYSFVGYSMDSHDTTSISAGKEVPDIVSKDMTIYSIFAETSVYDKELPSNAYTVTSVTQGNDTVNTLIFNANVDLAGKITIPAQARVTTGVNAGSIVTITRILNVDNTAYHPLNNVTHVYFAPNSGVNTIGAFCFSRWANLCYVELPNNEIYIENAAFQYVPRLFDGISQYDIDRFFNKIVNVRQYGFCGISLATPTDNTNQTYMYDKWIKLPNIKAVGNQAFLNTRCRGIMFGSIDNRQDYNSYGINVLEKTYITRNVTSQFIFYYNGSDADSVKDDILNKLWASDKFNNYIIYGLDIDHNEGSVDPV